MRYWFTTHWPRRVGEPSPDGVYVREEHLHIVDELAKGDLVVVYETARGPIRIVRHDNSLARRVPCLRGRQGIIAIWEIADLCDVPSDVQEYVGRPQITWCRRASAFPVDTGLVPRARAAALLGYSPNFLFRGYGTCRSGIKEIGQARFLSIRQELASIA